MSQVSDQVEAHRIGLLQVTEDQEHGFGASQLHEELDDGREKAKTIVTQIGCRSRERNRCAERWHEACQGRVCACKLCTFGLGQAFRVIFKRHRKRAASELVRMCASSSAERDGSS